MVFAVVAGLVVGAAVPSAWRPVTRVLAGWNVIVWLYLAQMAWLMATATRTRVREIAEREDNNAVVVLAILSIAAAFSLVAIVLELSSSKGLSDTQKVLHYVFTAITVFGSWLLVATTYTVHYARLFYLSPVKQRALRFPEEELHPGYADFLYFSFTIAVAAQTSDVLVMSPSIRKAVLAQSVLSFLFNAAIIGLSINIAAGLVGN
ncbi:putative transmembrane protein [Oxalobacteraceae bacterium IMCC9480]|nr:putative transmembrane protein [Oxalobacteraceae bacterium IMCC9480]